MNSLKEYITEKFKISKNIKAYNYSFIKGEKLIKVMYCPKYNYIAFPFDNTSRGVEIEYFYFNRIRQGIIYFTPGNDDMNINYKNEKVSNHYISDRPGEENNNGYFQCEVYYDNELSYIALYLNAQCGIDFINTICLNKDISKLNDYFDLSLYDYSFNKDTEFRLDNKKILDKILDILEK